MKIRTSISLSFLLLVAIVAFTPSLVFAKDREREREWKQEREHARTERKVISTQVRENLKELHDQFDDDLEDFSKPCSSFGHFIAPGWIFKNGSSTPSDNCTLPWGINMNWWWLFGNHGTTTPPADTTAPAISNVRAWPFLRAAFISWVTDEPSDSAVFWSTSSPVDVNSSSTPHREQSFRSRNHQMIIPGLSATTTYYAIVRSRDAAGNTAYSPEFSFTTGGAPTTPPPADTTAPVISGVSLSVSTSTMSVAWTTNENASSRVFYSTSTPVTASTSTTAYVESGTLLTNHNVTLSGLATSTTYYIRVQSADAAGNTQTSGEFSTTTAAL